MRPKLLARRLHKWLAIIVGAQLVIWAVSGFYMVVVDIDIIHGDMLVKPVEARLGSHLESALPIPELLANNPGASAVELRLRGERPVYLLNSESGRAVVDARSGEALPPLESEQAAAIARQYYSGEAPVAGTQLIEADPPSEIAFLPLPVWQVNFDDRWGTSFYIDPDSGRFMTRRHTLWRVFDFLWMLHILDYDTRENINNNLLRVAAAAALLMALSGCWLLWLRFRPRRARA